MKLAAVLILALVLGTACAPLNHAPVHTTINIQSQVIRKEAALSLGAFIATKKVFTPVEAQNYIMVSDALLTYVDDLAEVNRVEMLELVSNLPLKYRAAASLMIEVIVFEMDKVKAALPKDTEKNFALVRIARAVHEGVVLAVSRYLTPSD